MVFQIDEKDPRPLYQQIVDEVRRGVVVGALAADDPLPSVRQLAATLKVNPNTVQQAYRELERNGLVFVRRGQGTFICNGGARTTQERRRLARSVARRALQDALRHGLAAEELIDAIRQESEDAAPGEKAPASGGR